MFSRSDGQASHRDKIVISPPNRSVEDFKICCRHFKISIFKSRNNSLKYHYTTNLRQIHRPRKRHRESVDVSLFSFKRYTLINTKFGDKAVTRVTSLECRKNSVTNNHISPLTTDNIYCGGHKEHTTSSENE